MAHKISGEALARLQSNPECIRNICILAHVDHGKTTLSDCLISSNGIISQKLAGKVRYMDSTEEEQLRGITMKSSAITLLHHDEPARKLRWKKTAVTVEGASGTAGLSSQKLPYVVNLIDSPGHVDFSMDVATAARLCDGALVVIDALEGVCIQTHAVLRVAWAEGLRPCLILNKVDRLITELQLSPLEAYQHLCRILEQVNAIVSELYRAELMASLQQKQQQEGDAAAAEIDRISAAARAASGLSGDSAVDAELIESSSSAAAAGAGAAEGGPSSSYTFDAQAIDVDEQLESSILFDPTRGNVLFASAFDGWAFSLDDFAALSHAKLEVPRSLLRRALWGEWYYRPKTKKIVTGAAAAAANKGKPLAVSLMLERLWAIYDCIIMNPDEARLSKIVGLIGCEGRINKRDLGNKDAKIRLQAVMRAWLPVADAVLSMVVKRMPSPAEAQKSRVEQLWPSVLSILGGAVGGAAAAAVPSPSPSVDSSATTTGAAAAGEGDAVTAPPPALSSSSSSLSSSSAPEALVCPYPLRPDMSLQERLQRVRWCIEHCYVGPETDSSDSSSSSSPASPSPSSVDRGECVVFVSKMFAVPNGSLGDLDAPFRGGQGPELALAGAAAAVDGDAPASSSSSPASSSSSSASVPGRFPSSVQPVPPSAWHGMDQQQTGPAGSLLDLRAVNASMSSPAAGAGAGGSSGAGAGGGVDSDLSLSAGESLIAFARVLCGVLAPDSPVFVLGPKYNPRDPASQDSAHISCVSSPMPLYMMMGRELFPMRKAYAGSVIGIGQLDAHVLKTATLCSTPACASLSPMTFQTTPLVKVAVEPKDPRHLAAVERGLALLNQADPCVELTLTDSGEMQLSALGELHLDRCIKDLETRFARVPLKVSPPILNFCETIVSAAQPWTGPIPAAAYAAPAAVTAAGAGATEGADASDAASIASHGSASTAGAFPSSSPALLTSVSAISAGSGLGSPGGAAGAGAGGSEAPQPTAILSSNRVPGFPSNIAAVYPVSWALQEGAGTYFHPPSASVYATTADRSCTLQMRAVPLPEAVTQHLQGGLQHLREYNAALQAFTAMQAAAGSANGKGEAAAATSAFTSLLSSGCKGFLEELQAKLKAAGPEWQAAAASTVWAFGPKKAGPNLLICKVAANAAGAADGEGGGLAIRGLPSGLHSGDADLRSRAITALSGGLLPTPESAAAAAAVSKDSHPLIAALCSLKSSVLQGFQLATAAGPLCAEPLWGVAFVLESISFRETAAAAAAASAGAAAAAAAAAGVAAATAAPSAESVEGQAEDKTETPALSSSTSVVSSSSSPASASATLSLRLPSGQLITAARDACRVAFQTGTPRLVEAMFKCELQCSGGRGGGTTGEQLGKLYAVLARRRGEVISEDMLGTQTFLITAWLPVVESFGFADDLRKRTSGAATSPQLVFSHWQVLSLDPFFQPTTEEEREEFGETVYEGQQKNIARRFMEAVRERKGMPVDKKVVAHAEKQRTLARKK